MKRVVISLDERLHNRLLDLMLEAAAWTLLGLDTRGKKEVVCWEDARTGDLILEAR